MNVEYNKTLKTTFLNSLVSWKAVLSISGFPSSFPNNNKFAQGQGNKMKGLRRMNARNQDVGQTLLFTNFHTLCNFKTIFKKVQAVTRFAC